MAGKIESSGSFRSSRICRDPKDISKIKTVMQNMVNPFEYEAKDMTWVKSGIPSQKCLKSAILLSVC